MNRIFQLELRAYQRQISNRGRIGRSLSRMSASPTSPSHPPQSSLQSALQMNSPVENGAEPELQQSARKRKKSSADEGTEPRRLRRSHEACSRCRSKKIKIRHLFFPGGRGRGLGGREGGVLLAWRWVDRPCDIEWIAHRVERACASVGSPEPRVEARRKRIVASPAGRHRRQLPDSCDSNDSALISLLFCLLLPELCTDSLGCLL